MSEKWFHNWKHALITGKSGSGKSTALRQFHNESERVSIAVDPMRVFENGATCESLPEIRDALAQGYRRVIWIPSYDDEEARETFHNLLNFLFELSENTPNTEYQLIVDEAHRYGPARKNSAPLVKAIKEFRNHGGVVFAATQEPELIHKSLLRQGGYLIWCGTVPPWGRDYLEERHVDVDEINKNREVGDFAVIDSDRELVGRYRSKERYTT